MADGQVLDFFLSKKIDLVAFRIDPAIAFRDDPHAILVLRPHCLAAFVDLPEESPILGDSLQLVRKFTLGDQLVASLHDLT